MDLFRKHMHLSIRWVVESTFRDPKTRGCGLGDIKTMLETNNLGGKCADLNAMFVGLCRAVGIPGTRRVWGASSNVSARFQEPRQER